MSINKINKIIKFVDKYIKANETEKLKNSDYYALVNTISKEGKDSYPDITFDLVNSILSKKFSVKYFYKDALSCDLYPEYNALYSKIEIPKEYQHLQDQFLKLQSLPQPEQRTPEWFAYRRNRITASDTAAAIDENPYEPVESFIDKKCDPNHKFLDNPNVAWGKKYEFTATGIYQHIFNVEVVEFGALPSDKYEILGASPDGICSCRTLDNQFSEKLGTMLEIKCVAPHGRTIETNGDIPGHICPYYYYLQVQQQLECCDLEICDFWQCKILEYKDREEYLLDKCLKTYHTEGVKGDRVMIDPKIKKGMILEFHPLEWAPEFEGDDRSWKSKYIYPPRLDWTEQEYDAWVVKTMNNLQRDHSDVTKTHYFYKIVYWKLVQSHNQPIKRDRKLFSRILPVLNETWKKVEYYREHLDRLDDLKKIVERRKKFIKTNTDFSINTDLIKNKVLFLDAEDTKKKSKAKPKINKNESDIEDGKYKITEKINPDDVDFID